MYVCGSGSLLSCAVTLTCLHLLGPPIQVPLTPPPLRSHVALTFTIKWLTPFPIDSQSVPYPYTVPYLLRLTDAILWSCSVRVHFRSAPPCLVPCSMPLPSLLCSFSLSNPWPHHLIDFPLGLFPQLLWLSRCCSASVARFRWSVCHSFVPLFTFAIV